MDPTPIVTKAADGLFDKGVLGTVCVLLILALVGLGLVIRRLYNDNQALHMQVTQRLGEALVAFNASTAAVTETRGTLQTLNGTISIMGDAVGEMSHENAQRDSEVRHGLANISASLNAVAQLLERIRDRAMP